MSPDAIEERIRRCVAEGDHRAATTILIEGYGPEILGFLRSRRHDASAADEVFSMWSEDVFHGLATFEWRCTARAWAYILARHAESRYRASPHARAAHNLPLSAAGDALAVADRVRTSTRPHLRSEVKAQFRALRERLEEEEQVILVLRVDKRMAWNDIACVTGGAETEGDALTRESVRIRKRFQLIKEKLRRWAAVDGVLPMG